MSNSADNDRKPDEPEEQAAGLSDSEIKEISETLHSGYEDAIIQQLSQLEPADAAELISKVSDEDRERLIEDHSSLLDPNTFTELDPELRRSMLESMPPAQVAALLSELESDDALLIISNLDEEFQKEIIRKLSGRLRLNLREGLSFPEKSAGRLMQREFVAVPQFWTVGKTLDYLRAAATELPEDFLDVFLITLTYRVVGRIPLNRLIRAGRSQKVKYLLQGDIHTIPADMDQEEAALIFKKYNLTSAPVVDAEERLIGVITVDDVIDVITEEAQEDFLKMAGVESHDLYRAVLATTGWRFRWLFLNLLTAIMASVVISWFDATIQHIVALAILMPIVASMGGNAGTQALTVAVRALATRELSKANAWRIVWKETFVGLLNGIGFAILMGAIAGIWFTSPALGFVIAAAMIINLICAGFFGAGIPIVLYSMGSDPAVSSAVFLTTVTDVVGFFAFLGLAALFLT